MESADPPRSAPVNLSRGRIPAGTSLQKVVDEVGVRLKRLYTADDYLSSTSTEDINFLQQTIRYGKTPADKDTICTSMCKVGVSKVFEKIWNKHSGEGFCDPDGTTDILYNNMMGILSVMWNGTDKSAKLCTDVHKNSVYENILKYLQLPQLKPALTKDKDECAKQHRCMRIVKGLLGVLHNVVQKVFDAREALRGAGAFQLLQGLRGSVDETTATKALMVQAYIVTDAENEQINSHEDTFKYLVKLLHGCLSSPGHYYSFTGYHADEILAAINRLAVNDSNKCSIVKAGALPHYVKVLQGDVVEEQRIAAEGLWTLAFKSKDDIIKEPGCVEALTKLSESSKDAEVKKQVDGVLWIIRGNDQAPIRGEVAKGPLGPPPKEGQPQPKQPAKSDKSEQHVFISYQWDCKSIVLQLRDKLRASGFKVWVDVDSMSGSVLESMAAAVENAAVVLICLTNKYKESPNCRTEAEYTFRLHKSIVPLRLQEKYYPDGWLGALIGSKLVHDFTKEFEFVFPELVRDLNSRGRGGADGGDEPDSKGHQSSNHSGNLGSNNQGQGSNGQAQASASYIESWTKKNITEWLNKNKLNHRKDWFAEFDGSLLQELRIMRRDAPDVFYSMLKDNKFNMIDILKVNKALKEL